MKGKPKFKVDDRVFFTLKNEGTFYGSIYIVDSYGTFEDPSDVSYDIMVDEYGPKKEQCLFKHITESLVNLDPRKKIYLSLPMTVMPNDIGKRYLELKNYVDSLSKYKDYIKIGPINIDRFITNPNYTEKYLSYSYCIGKDIENVINCDAIIMGRGWEKGPGCRVEHFTAQTYNKDIIYQLYET